MRCTSLLVAVATFAGSVSAFMPATPVLRSSSARHVALGNAVVGARRMPGAAVGYAVPVSGAPRSRQALSQLRMGDFCKVVSAEELEVAIQVRSLLSHARTVPPHGQKLGAEHGKAWRRPRHGWGKAAGRGMVRLDMKASF